MNKQKNYRRRQRGITPITTPRNSPGVAQFSMSEVAQFSVSLDKVFDSYDAAYEVVERYYADMCCSDDREYYRIEVLSEELPSSPHLIPPPEPSRQ